MWGYSVWVHVVAHKEEIVWAIILALIFALIVDFIGVGSRLRAGVRELNNRWAERSAQNTITRIRHLEEYQTNLRSERWLYLFAFQCVFGSLLSLSVGALFFAFAYDPRIAIHPRTVSALIGLSLASFSTAGSFASGGFREVSRNTREKVDSVIQKVGLEIEGLQKKLKERSPRDTA